MNIKSTCSSLELYLYYSLSIEPFDNQAIKIRKSIDLDYIYNNLPILKNNEVQLLFDNNSFCPISTDKFIDTCYIEYEKDSHNIKILFYKIFNCELLTPDSISKNANILTCIHRTINLENNLLEDYNKFFQEELDNILKVVSEKRYYNLNKLYVKDTEGKIYSPFITNYPFDEILKKKTYDYQKDNINWMLELEKNPIQEYISSDKLLFFPDGRIYNYTLNKFIKNEERKLVKFKGGYILDEVGIGKTLQLLCLAMLDTSINTIIVVPDHLENHWYNQFDKHFNIKLPDFICIVKFSLLKNCDIKKYNRMIVDEIHELYSNKNNVDILELCLNTGCKYKWGISATPFIVSNSIYFLLKFLTEEKFYYPNIDRFSYFYDTYYKIFRKNTLKNIVKEIKLPQMIEHNIILEFNDQERILYDSEVQANNNCDEYFLRKCCCDVMINFNNKEKILSLTDFNNIVLNDYKCKYDVETQKLNIFLTYLQNCKKTLSIINSTKKNNLPQEEILEIEELKLVTNVQELINNINHYELKIKEQKITVENRKKSYEYLNSKINDTNKECPVCMGEIKDDDKYNVTECGHITCYECMAYWLANNSSCPSCRRNINKQNMYTITNLNQVKLKCSSKVDKLLEIIKLLPNKDNKIIIYSQFDIMIEKLVQTLNFEGIKSIYFENSNQIEYFMNDINSQVLIISSVKNASGIDLSFVSNIIIFEPIIGDTLYLRDIEKQIIGRIYRINQEKNINVYRFIIQDTIEHDIYKKAIEFKN